MQYSQRIYSSIKIIINNNNNKNKANINKSIDYIHNKNKS